jgi:hypothetical protein
MTIIVACPAKAVGVWEHIMASREEGPGVVIGLDGLSYEASIEVLEAIEGFVVTDEELYGGIGVRWVYIRLVKQK